MSGIIAAFETENALRCAVASLRDRQIGYETYTPKPLDENPAGSSLPLVMFIAGMAGFCGSFLFMTWGYVWYWAIDIGGRPTFSWPAFVPIAFELGILSAVAAGFIGYFVICALPRLYEPVSNCASIRRATRDLWLVAVENDDWDCLAQAHRLLADHRPLLVEEIGEE
jgi:hypothetical protein